MVIQRVGYIAKVATELGPFEDDGSESGREIPGERPLAGQKIGSSNFARNHATELFSTVKRQNENREFHGAGSRYNEKSDGSDAIVENCFHKLPLRIRKDTSRHPYAIRPNFDIEMNLIGW